MQQIKIIEGTYRNEVISNVVVPMLAAPKEGAKGMYVTVDASSVFGAERNRIRVKIECEDFIEYLDGDEEVAEEESSLPECPIQARETIREKFALVELVSNAVCENKLRSVIISGPPGVGKSSVVEKVVDNFDALNAFSSLGAEMPVYKTVKGNISGIGLYKALYECSSPGSVIVFDDCDRVLFDETSLNLLKAVLDTGKTRKVSWLTESNALKQDDIPNTFEFCGNVIFITNLDFGNVRSDKLRTHLEAVLSRSHYIDMGMNKESERFVRIEQVIEDGMLDRYGFSQEQKLEVVDFMKEHAKNLQEITLRMVIKISDLRQISDTEWRKLAMTTCFKRK